PRGAVVGIAVAGILEQTGEDIDVLGLPPVVVLPLGRTAPCGVPFAHRDDGRIIVGDRLTVRLAVALAQLEASQRSLVFQEQPDVGARPVAGRPEAYPARLDPWCRPIRLAGPASQQAQTRPVLRRQGTTAVVLMLRLPVAAMLGNLRIGQ